MAASRQKTAMILAGILVFAAVAPGCSTLQTDHTALQAASAQAEKPPVRGYVVVQLRSGQKRAEYLRAPLTDTMLVQTALKESGALSRYHRMNVTLVRKMVDGQRVRMPVHLNSKTRQVTDATNFALHPDDVIEVVEDTTTLVDRMIDSALEPLGPLTRDYRHR